MDNFSLPPPPCQGMDITLPGQLTLSTIRDSGTLHSYLDFQTFTKSILPAAHLSRSIDQIKYLKVMTPTVDGISSSPTTNFLRKSYQVVHYVSIPCRIGPDTKRIKFHVLKVGSDNFTPVIGALGIYSNLLTL